MAELLGELGKLQRENRRLRRRVRDLERGRAIWRERAVAYWNGKRSKRRLAGLGR